MRRSDFSPGGASAERNPFLGTFWILILARGQQLHLNLADGFDRALGRKRFDARLLLTKAVQDSVTPVLAQPAGAARRADRGGAGDAVGRPGRSLDPMLVPA